MKKTNILMVLGNTGRGGAQTFAVNVLRTIDRDKFQVDFVVNEIVENGYTKEIRDLGSEIYEIPYYKVYNHFQYKKAFCKVLNIKQYDIVHGHVSSSAVVYLKCARKFGCITIAHSHSAGYRGNTLETFIKWIYTIGARYQANYWFACSDKAAIRLFGKKYSEYENYFYIPNAIKVSNFRYKSSIRKKIREQLGLSSDTKLFGHIGSFTTPKNHSFLLEIFYEIAERMPKSRFVLIGNGELQKQIETKINELNLQDRIIMTGNIENVNQYMMAMDEMIFPSLFEGFPISVLEAEAVGTHVLLSDTITSEVYLNEFVYPFSLNCSATDWADKALEVVDLKIDREYCNRIVAKTNYNIDNNIESLSALYTDMISTKQ